VLLMVVPCVYNCRVALATNRNVTFLLGCPLWAVPTLHAWLLLEPFWCDGGRIQQGEKTGFDCWGEVAQQATGCALLWPSAASQRCRGS
jgi:hypothetical protein